MRFYEDIHIVLSKCADMPGYMLAWCPQFDVASQGKGAENAVGMLFDAIQMVIAGDLSAGEWVPDMATASAEKWERKRVYHPRRRGMELLSLEGDPEHTFWKGMCDPDYKKREAYVVISAKEFDEGPEMMAIMDTYVRIFTLGGIVFSQFDLHGEVHLQVPGLNFSVTGEVMPRKVTTFCTIRKALATEETIPALIQANFQRDNHAGTMLSYEALPNDRSGDPLANIAETMAWEES